ncbi:MAG: DNA polymerase III subunit beta [Rikenellaceae bacterium]
MKFTVSSQALQQLLTTTGKTISNKNSLPILDHFLMDLKGNVLTVTASDLETTMIATLAIDSTESEGAVAAPAKLLLDTLKGFADIPLTIEAKDQSFAITVSWSSGSLTIPGANPTSYPEMKELAEERRDVTFGVENLLNGLNKTSFATADDDLRPVMNGVLFNFEPTTLTFVATDAHKLVKCSVVQDFDFSSSFILPKKPVGLLKSVLFKSDSEVALTFDSQSARFIFKNYTLVCRLIDGSYPNYNAVIPQKNPNKVIVDRMELVNSIRRVAICSNPTTNLIRLDVSSGAINLNAQDIDFFVSANETLSCGYDGDPITIGFKSTFLVEILTNIDSQMVTLELADSTRAGVFKPIYDGDVSLDSLMLLMPMMINA